MSDTYMELVLEGRAPWTDIEAHVEQWHAGSPTATIHEFLGMTWDEYALWVEQPRALRLIIAARKHEEPIEDIIRHVDEFALAARGLDPEDARAVRKWLQETGRLPKH